MTYIGVPALCLSNAVISSRPHGQLTEFDIPYERVDNLGQCPIIHAKQFCKILPTEKSVMFLKWAQLPVFDLFCNFFCEDDVATRPANKYWYPLCFRHTVDITAYKLRQSGRENFQIQKNDNFSKISKIVDFQYFAVFSSFWRDRHLVFWRNSISLRQRVVYTMLCMPAKGNG